MASYLKLAGGGRLRMSNGEGIVLAVAPPVSAIKSVFLNATLQRSRMTATLQRSKPALSIETEK